MAAACAPGHLAVDGAGVVVVEGFRVPRRVDRPVGGHGELTPFEAERGRAVRMAPDAWLPGGAVVRCHVTLPALTLVVTIAWQYAVADLEVLHRPGGCCWLHRR